MTSSQRIARPYLVGLGATVIASALTGGMLLASSASASREQMRETKALEVIDALRLPSTVSALGSSADCSQVNIERCLLSSQTPPKTLDALTPLFAAAGPVTQANCGTDTKLREAMRRCSFQVDLDGVPVEVMLWPHINPDGGLTMQGTDVWINIKSESDV